MSITYNKSTNFTAKDSMATSNPDKLLSGVPFDFEFDAISDAFQEAVPSLNPVFTGTVTADAITANTINGSTTSTWDTAYGWGDHGAEGYLTSFSETDPVFLASPAADFEAGDKADLDTVVSWNTTHGAKTTDWDYAHTTIANKEAIWDSKVEEVPNPTSGAQYARVDGAWAIVEADASSSLTQAQIDGFIDASDWVVDHGTDVTGWDAAFSWGNHAVAGYATDDPAIITNGSTPSLASGITGAEVRSLIGAGDSSFDGSYNSLSNKPTIPTNNNQLTNGAGYSTYTGSDAVKLSGTQVIGGSKTFDQTIVGDISGNADTATTATSATSATTATTAGSATNCTRSVSAGTNLTGGGNLTANRTISLDSSLTNLTSVETDKVEVGVFTISTRSNGFLEIKIGNTKLFELTSDGDLRVRKDITAHTTGF